MTPNEQVKKDVIQYIELCCQARLRWLDQADRVINKFSSFPDEVASRYQVTADDLLVRRQRAFDQEVMLLFHEWYEIEMELATAYREMMDRHVLLNEEWKTKRHVLSQRYLETARQVLADRADLRTRVEKTVHDINKRGQALIERGAALASPGFEKAEGFLNMLSILTADIVMVRLVQPD